MKYVYLVLIVLLAFAACTASPQEVEEESPMQEDAESETDTSADEESGVVIDDARAQMLALFDEQDGRSYQVEYTATAEGQTIMQMTQYVDTGLSRVRVDTEVQGMSSRTIIVGEDTYMCEKMNQWNCFEASNQEPEQSFVYGREEFERDADIAVESAASRVVAGEQTSCFVFSSTQDGDVEQCFSEEGVPLYIRTESAAGSTLTEASSYSLSVPEDAFELPAEPGSAESMYGGFDPSAYQ